MQLLFTVNLDSINWANIHIAQLFEKKKKEHIRISFIELCEHDSNVIRSKLGIAWITKEHKHNKANLRDLIAATGLVILLKLDSNHRFFNRCDLEIWLMTSKNYRALFLHYIKLCASSQTPRWIRTGVTVRKRSIRVKIGDFYPVWPCNLMDDLEKQ